MIVNFKLAIVVTVHWRWLIRLAWRRRDVPSAVTAAPRLWLHWLRSGAT